VHHREDFDMARKPDDLHPTMVRLPEGLRRDLEQSADRHGRSLNAEIIYLLNQSLYQTRQPDPSLVDRLDRIERVLRSFGGLMKAQQKVAQDAVAALKSSVNKPKDDGEEK
jgi:plasmid stability protein